MVAARLRDVVVGEAEPSPVVDVVAQVQVEADGLPADLSCLVCVGGQHHLVFRRQVRRRSDRLSGLCGVLRRGQVGVGTRTAILGQLQHPGSERCHDPPGGRHVRRIQLVEVLHQRVVRFAVVIGVLRVAHADAEQEPARVGTFDAVVGLRDLSRGDFPDVDDAGRDLQRLGGLEDRFGERQLGRR